MSLIRKGLIGELKVETMLLERGFNVYSNVCDDDGVDFIIEKNNKFKKIQVKTSTKLSNKEKRYSFRFGNTGIKSDFYICIMPNNVAIIPSNSIGSIKAFQIYPETKRERGFSKRFIDKWDLLED